MGRFILCICCCHCHHVLIQFCLAISIIYCAIINALILMVDGSAWCVWRLGYCDLLCLLLVRETGGCEFEELEGCCFFMCLIGNRYTYRMYEYDHHPHLPTYPRPHFITFLGISEQTALYTICVTKGSKCFTWHFVTFRYNHRKVLIISKFVSSWCF